jgi:hypothetical protein
MKKHSITSPKKCRNDSEGSSPASPGKKKLSMDLAHCKRKTLKLFEDLNQAVIPDNTNEEDSDDYQKTIQVQTKFIKRQVT